MFTVHYGEQIRPESALTFGTNIESMFSTCSYEVRSLVDRLRYGYRADAQSMLKLDSSGLSKYTFIDIQFGAVHKDNVYYQLRGKPDTFGDCEYSPVWTDKAQSTSIVRLFKSLFTSETLEQYGITDSPQIDQYGKKYSVFERLSDCAKLYICPDFQIQIVSGSEIADWYSTTNSEHLSSCMQSCPDSYFQIYADCPDCSLLVVTLDGVLVGRRLLWRNVQTASGLVWYADRYYTSRQQSTELVRQYVLDSGYTVLYEQSRSSMTVQTGAVHRYENYPYMDTFAYLSSDYSRLSSSSGKWYLDSTSGRLGTNDDDDDDDDEYYCSDCNDSLYAPVWYNGLPYCSDCYDKRTAPVCSYCSEQSMSCVWYVKIMDYMCSDCLIDNRTDVFYTCLSCGGESMFRQTSVTDLNSEQSTVCTDCVFKHYRYSPVIMAWIPIMQSVMDVWNTPDVW
jgi:hypothetical protein